MNENRYDIAIIGAGPGGYMAAIKAARAGKKVVIFEKEEIGGICINYGCVPSKTLIEAANTYHRLKNDQLLPFTGINQSLLGFDWQAMIKSAQKNTQKAAANIKNLFSHKNITLIKGEAKVFSSNSIKCNEQDYFYDDLIIASGSHYPTPDFMLAGKKHIYTPKTIYSISRLPETLAIVGAGVIGVEFAILFARLGVKVTLLESKQQIMPYLDDDLQKELLKMLEREKIEYLSGHRVTNFDDDSGLLAESIWGDKYFKADAYLSAVSRHANLDGLSFLIKNGLELKNGFIRTNNKAQTTLPHVYAVGDVNGRFMLAHVASKEASVAVSTILNIEDEISYDLLSYNMYSYPEFASVGMTEKRAQGLGFLVATGKFPFSANVKAMISNETDGFIKVVFDKETEEILGVHIVGANATDLISEAILAMSQSATVSELAKLTHPHPTLSEGMVEAIFKGLGKPVNIL